MSSNESAAYEIMRSLDVDYVLIIFGGVIGYSGDDINKFLWMVRIAEGEHPKDIRVSGTSTFWGFLFVLSLLWEWSLQWREICVLLPFYLKRARVVFLE